MCRWYLRRPVIILVAALLVLLSTAVLSCYSPLSPTTAINPTPTTAPSPIVSPPVSSVSLLPELFVHFIDVGQGDSILLDLGETEVLIDGGKQSPGVTAYLGDYVDGSLEGVVATHTDSDHIGGLIDVLDDFAIDNIWLNGYTTTTATYQDFMQRVNSEGAQVKIGRRGDTITVGNLTFSVLNPVDPLFSDSNNNSVVLMLSYGSVDFLFMGDAETEAEDSMIAAGVLEDIDILKVGHHGSCSSTSPAFLNIVQPEIAIYMAGVGNAYGHPCPGTISELQAIGAGVYGTDTCSTITITTNGDSYIVVYGTSTLTPTPTPVYAIAPTPIPAPSPTPEKLTDVQITRIFYDGSVYRTESDEYVEIKNLGQSSQDLKGWVLKDISEGYPTFVFPSYVLVPNAVIRVYTNQIHSEWGGFSFHYGKAIWNNTNPDTAALYDSLGNLVSKKSY
jgi:competence protein ComEC